MHSTCASSSGTVPVSRKAAVLVYIRPGGPAGFSSSAVRAARDPVYASRSRIKAFFHLQSITNGCKGQAFLSAPLPGIWERRRSSLCCAAAHNRYRGIKQSSPLPKIGCQFWCLGEDIPQISVWVQTICESSLDYTDNNRTCSGTSGCIGKRKFFRSITKGLILRSARLLLISRRPSFRYSDSAFPSLCK